jgi:hypothetical protein
MMEERKNPRSRNERGFFFFSDIDRHPIPFPERRGGGCYGLGPTCAVDRNLKD